jgi:AcrR family transcriptional regulator
MTPNAKKKALSPSKGERTREHILNTAGDLFHAQGINATSLGDVLRASGAGKGQFYFYFHGRDALLEQVLKKHQATLKKISHPIESWNDLKKWMDYHVMMQSQFKFERGCPIGTAAYAIQPGQEASREILKTIFAAMRRNIATFLERERDEGRLDKKAQPARLAAFAVANVQGGLLLSLTERGPAPAKAAIKECFSHLKSFVLENAR